MTEPRRSHCSYNFQLYLGFNAFASFLNLWPQTQRGTMWTTVCGSTSQKRAYYTHGKSGRFISVIPNDNTPALWFLRHLLSLPQCCSEVETELVWDCTARKLDGGGNTSRKAILHFRQKCSGLEKAMHAHTKYPQM